MDGGDFQWDDTKATRNHAQHGVTIQAAQAVFKDPLAIEWQSDGQDQGEQRFAIVGMVANRLMFVAYTLRGDAIRLISARLAEPIERRKYHDQT